MTEQLVPGQWDYARPADRKELAATAVLELPLAEASVKVRTGGPHDDAEDYDPTSGPGSARPADVRGRRSRTPTCARA